nr:hydrolase [Streptococcus thermophilus]
MQLSGFTAGPFQTNTYVVVGEADSSGRPAAFVVDPGLGTVDKVKEILGRNDAQLECVVLTHGHIDHTRECAEFGVPVYIHPDDEVMLDPKWGAPGQFAQLFQTDEMKMPSDLRHLESGAAMTFAGIEFRVVHAPGHSPGSSILVNDENNVALTGDVIFAGTIGRTDLPLGDPAAMNESLAGPVWDLDDSLTLLPGHGAATTMDKERRTNPFLIEAGSAR